MKTPRRRHKFGNAALFLFLWVPMVSIVGLAADAEEPVKTFYSTWDWQTERGQPYWIPLEEAVDSNFRDLDEDRRIGLGNVLSRPVHPERACVEVPYLRDHYFGVGPGQANLILRVAIQDTFPGIGEGIPGYLFRAETETVVSSQDMEAPPTLVFFMSRGRITIDGTDICLDDHRFPVLEKGDEAILFIESFRPRDTPGPALAVVGEGHILGIRKGKILQEGFAYRALGEPAPEDLESVLAVLRVGVDYRQAQEQLGLPDSDYSIFPWVPRSQRSQPADGKTP